MKKNYFLTLLLTLCFSVISFGQTPVITMISDGDCTGGTPKVLEIYANGTVDFTLYSLENQTNTSTTWGNQLDLSSLGTVTDGFVYIYNGDDAIFTAEYPNASKTLKDTGSTTSVNGDDRVRIIKTSDSSVIDQYGVTDEDGSGKDWEYKDGYSKRKDGTTANAGTFNSANWTFANGALDGKGTCQGGSTYESIIGIGTYAAVASTDPELKIDSPTDGSTITYTANPVVKFTVSNFNVAAGGAGDGFIKWKLDDVDQTDKTDTSDITFSATAGTTYKVYIELVDNNGDPLSSAVNKTTTFTVDHPCDLVLADITAVCDALTSGTDTFTGSIDFTGGNTGVTYTITAVDRDDNNVSLGTIGGDDPSSATSGKITITGIPEGKDITVKIVGDANSSCDFSRNIYSPTCIAFPIIEPFDYADAANLGDQERWENVNSGDEILVTTSSLDYTGLAASTGNKIKFDENGIDALTRFNNVTSGTVYASFMFKITAFQTNNSPDVSDGGYFAALAGGSSSYDARLWVRPNPDTAGSTFDIGFGHESFSPTFTSSTYDLDDVIFVVMGYNMDTKVTSVWINPDASSFEGTIPAATLTTTDDNPPSSINTFIIRQDSDKETPFIEMDELRISTSWADVTPKDNTASISDNLIDGFSAYPNPVRNGKLTITSATSDVKNVSIYNVLGRKVFSQNITGTSKQLNIASVTSGVYILKVVEGTKSSTKKLVIR